MAAYEPMCSPQFARLDVLKICTRPGPLIVRILRIIANTVGIAWDAPSAVGTQAPYEVFLKLRRLERSQDARSVRRRNTTIASRTEVDLPRRQHLTSSECQPSRVLATLTTDASILMGR